MAAEVGHPAVAKIPVADEAGPARFAEYQAAYARSVGDDSDAFWAEKARDMLHFFRDFDTVTEGSFAEGDISWFLNGELNACFCCVDQHLPTKADQTALVWEGDEPGQGRSFTYRELYREINKIANAMKASGVRKGDTVAIYLPMIPELAMTMLACARIGAVHSVVFAGFSAESLRERILVAQSKWVFVSDQGKRGGKTLQLKAIADAACADLQDLVKNVFVFKRTNAEVNWVEGRDVWMNELAAVQRPYCPCERMDSEDLLFILFTSGSTGKPKGVAHSTAGYLLYAGLTCKETFGLRDGDVHACVADCGWITGHSYIVYGPLVNGTTTLMFESTPTYPDHGRYWDLVQRHRVTSFYTAPTALRALMSFADDDKVRAYDRSSLRVLGTVGEPINPEAWRWYHDHIGRGRCTIADTYWQTETGGHVAVNMPGAAPMKPGSCALPYYGIEFAVVDAATGKEIHGNGVEGVLCIKRPWPSMARTVYGDHDRFMNVYLRPYPGFYFTGDGCKRDENGYYTITGRVDDVINPSGHRIGTAEVESALVACAEVSESAVVGFPHEVKGEGICCFVILRNGIEGSLDLATKLKGAVRAAIGPFATPDLIIFSDLPKTRSGKIMRRILRKVAAGESDSIGDVSTLADSSIVEKLIQEFDKVASASRCK